jgi:hypothetical protein
MPRVISTRDRLVNDALIDFDATWHDGARRARAITRAVPGLAGTAAELAGVGRSNGTTERYVREWVASVRQCCHRRRLLLEIHMSVLTSRPLVLAVFGVVVAPSARRSGAG